MAAPAIYNPTPGTSVTPLEPIEPGVLVKPDPSLNPITQNIFQDPQFLEHMVEYYPSTLEELGIDSKTLRPLIHNPEGWADLSKNPEQYMYPYKVDMTVPPHDRDVIDAIAHTKLPYKFYMEDGENTMLPPLEYPVFNGFTTEEIQQVIDRIRNEGRTGRIPIEELIDRVNSTAKEKVEMLYKIYEDLAKLPKTPMNIARLARTNNTINILEGKRLTPRLYDEYLKDSVEKEIYEKALKDPRNAVPVSIKEMLKFSDMKFVPVVKTSIMEHKPKEQDVVKPEREEYMWKALSEVATQYAANWVKMVHYNSCMIMDSFWNSADRMFSSLGKTVRSWLGKAKTEGTELTITRTDPIEKIDPKVLEALTILWRFTYNSYRPGVEIEIAGYKVAYDQFAYDRENAGFMAAIHKAEMDAEKANYTFVLSNRGTQDQNAIQDDLLSGSFMTFKEYAGVTLPVPLRVPFAPALRVSAMESFIHGWVKTWQQMRGRIDNIFITGHSLGGGTTEALLALLTQVAPPSVANKIGGGVFEAMRGMDIESQRKLTKTNPFFHAFDIKAFERVQMAIDVVPNAPLKQMGGSHATRRFISIGKACTDLLGILSNPLEAFNTDRGGHSMQPTSATLEFVAAVVNNPTKYYPMIDEAIKKRPKEWIEYGFSIFRGLATLLYGPAVGDPLKSFHEHLFDEHDYIAKYDVAYGMIRKRKRESDGKNRKRARTIY